MSKEPVGHAQLSTSLSSQQIKELSDRELLNHCQYYGRQAKLWKQRFLGLLPEVDERRLYLQQGCSSVVEFAAKVGGVSKEQALIALRLYERFGDLPVLKAALTSGQISVNKLARVVSVATSENQEFWLNKSQLLSNRALETLVQDTKSLHVQTKKVTTSMVEKIPQSDELRLSHKIRERLLSLQNKGISLDKLLGELLDQREEQIQQEKHQVAAEKISLNKATGKQLMSRYIPARVKRVLKQQFGEKCAHSNCVNKAVNIHHQRRFALDPSYDPAYLLPLCKQHHEIAHVIDKKYIEARVN